MPDVSDREMVISNVDGMLSFYEREIQDSVSFFDMAHNLLSEYQNTLLKNRSGQGLFNTQIRGILAKNENLRKKDFDNMIHNIFFIQEKQEKKIMLLLKKFLNDQRFAVTSIKKNLMECKDSLAVGDSKKIDDFRLLLISTLNTLEKKKTIITSKLKDFKRQQAALSFHLQKLSDKGENLKVKDLKQLIRWIITRNETRNGCID